MNAAILDEQRQPTHRDPKPDPAVAAEGLDPEAAAEAATVQKIRELPKDIGVMLMAVGVAGVVLPGLMGSPAIVAGGLVLWPKAFGRVESWFERTFPKAHREGMRQIDRYLDDLDRRYSFTEKAPESASATSADSQTQSNAQVPSPRSEAP